MKPPSTTANGSGSDPSATANAPQALLRLWLPGYHTPSLNRTAGKHWVKGHRLKKLAAAAVYEALRGKEFEVSSFKFQVAEARRVLAKIIMGLPVEGQAGTKGKKGPRPALPERPAWVRFERVTTRLLDEENFKGSTKGLMDCLKMAFASVILDDAPGYVVLEHVQTQCAKKCEEGTWVWVAAARPMLDAGGSMLDGRRAEGCTAEIGRTQRPEF